MRNKLQFQGRVASPRLSLPKVSLSLRDRARVRAFTFFSTLTLLCFLSVLSANAGLNVQFYFYNAIGWPLTNANCTLTPYSVGLTNSGVSTLDQIPFQLDTSGQYTFTNLASGSYTVRENSTVFVITVTNGPGTVLATNLISGLQVPGTTAVYTRSQSDARYLQWQTNGVPTVTATNWVNTNGDGGFLFLSGGTNFAIFDFASNSVVARQSITNLGYQTAYYMGPGWFVTNLSISFTWHAL